MKSSLNFRNFEKKMTLLVFVFRNLRTPKMWLDKCLKCPFSDDRWTTNLADVRKHCWYLYDSIFIILIDYFQVNLVGKSLSYWQAKSWYILLTHWLRMKSILFLIQTIQRYQFRCSYLRNKKLFLNCWRHFWNLG